MADRFPLSDCWFLAGPTASGKTIVGMELAIILGAESVSLDSMAVFRGMDLGTAKPVAAERAAVRHHLLDLVDPDREFSLAQYVDAAHAAAGEIASRGRKPLFVGGTPLYLKALLRGLFGGPAADWDLRRRWQRQAELHGVDWLHAQLVAVDPVSASRLHPHDARRAIRALEVFEKTGRPISDWQRQFDRPPANPPPVFVLDWPRDLLYDRIDRRVDAMFAAGLVDEVRGLLARFGALSRTASQALGYREVIELLAGRRDEAETVQLVKTRTRQFAKRQLTWFRSLVECRPLPVGPTDEAATIARRIVEAWEAETQ